MRRERERLKAHYGKLFLDVSEVLFQHDPQGINFEDNTDEYDPETGTILPRLKDCHSESDVLSVIIEEFRKWFSDDPGDEKALKLAAYEIRQLWQESEFVRE
ncbi:MAG: hypothetical protein KF685_07665 [Acidobacteria bacterium]|nr:hypothetical protein [Acidobacteriota bacterium]